MSVPAGGLSLIEHGMPGQNAPATGRGTVLFLFVRVLTGVAAILVAVLDAIGHATIVRLGTVLLLLLGIGLVLGLASRLCALLLLVVALVIVATAGRSEGGAPLYGGALLALGCLLVVARGGGRPQLLDRVDPRAW